MKYTLVSNAQEIVHNPEISDHWHDSIMPQSFGVEPTRGWGFSHIERPLGVADGDVWDWAGVQGSWCGSYAFLEYVLLPSCPLRTPLDSIQLSRKKNRPDLLGVTAIPTGSPSTNRASSSCAAGSPN